MMRLVVVVQKYGLFTQSSESQVELDRLIPRHGFIGISMLYHQRRVDSVGIKYGRILNIGTQILPHTYAQPALRLLVLKLTSQAAPPSNTAICAGHVTNGSACNRSCKNIGLSNHLCSQIPAP